MNKYLAVFVVILTVLAISVASLSPAFADEGNAMETLNTRNSSVNSTPVSSQSNENVKEENDTSQMASQSQPSTNQNKTKRSTKAKLATSSGIYHATAEELKGTAYAVFNADTGELDFIRSTETHSNGDTGTVKSISGGTYTGTIYTGFEDNTTPYHFDSSYPNSNDFFPPWYSKHAMIQSVNVVDAIKPNVTAVWFEDFTNCTSMDLTKLDTSKVTTMYWMFTRCSKLSTLDASSFDTSSVTTMSWMFNRCSKLTTLDVSHFDTSKVTTMDCMFANCESLTTLDVSHFDTSKVTTMSCMFYGCRKLALIDVSHFDTSNVLDLWGIFSNCLSVKTLDITSFNTSKCQRLGCMFELCTNLETVDVSGLDTSSCNKFDRMFYGCEKVKSLDVSHFDTSSATDNSAASEWAFQSMFDDCPSLTSLNCSSFTNPNNGRTSYMFCGDKSLNQISFKNFMTNGSPVFDSPAPTTASGLISDGTWGLGSETAKKKYSSDELTELGKTAGALSGTWYAQAKKYTVTLDANNGTGARNTINIVNGSSDVLPTNVFKRASYKFVGWNTQSDGTGTAYADEATISPMSDVTLYAQWKFVPCIIRIPKAISCTHMPVGIVSTDDSYDISVDGSNMYDVSITSATDGLVDGTATLNAIVDSAGNPLTFTGDGTKQDRVQIKGTARYSGKYKGSINYKVKVTAK